MRTKKSVRRLFCVGVALFGLVFSTVSCDDSDYGGDTSEPVAEATATPEPSLIDYVDGTTEGGDPLNPDDEDARVGNKVQVCPNDCTCDQIPTVGTFVITSCP